MLPNWHFVELDLTDMAPHANVKHFPVSLGKGVLHLQDLGCLLTWWKLCNCVRITE